MPRAQRIALLSIGLAAAMVVAACGGSSGSSSEFQAKDVTGVINGTLPEDGPPESGGKLTITDPSDPPTLDPHKAASAYTHFDTSGIVYSTLVAYKHGRDIPYYSQEFEGDLAESWTHSDDGLTWTFNLRKGVKFQNIAPVNGREFTSADVACTIDRIKSLPGVQKNLVDIIAKTDASDPYKVVFTLNSPYGALDETMASFYMEMLPCEGTRGQFDLGTTPIGTGPFILTSFERKVKRSYVKNPTYYKPGQPYLDAVDVLTMSDPAAQLAAFRAGQLDISGVSEQNYPALKGSNPDVLVRVQELLTPSGIFINQANKPFDDVRVRQAMMMAWDRNTLGSTTYTAYSLTGAWPGVEMGGMTDEEVNKVYPYDPEAAKKLLAEAGYPNGFSFDLMTTDGWGPTITNQAQWVQEDLKKIGVTANLKILDYATFYSTWQKEDYQVGFGYFTGFLTTNEWVKSFYPTDGSRNWQNLDDPKLNQMIKDQEGILDQTKRAAALHDINEYITQNVSNPLLGLQGSSLSIQQQWVHNYYSDPAYARAWIADVWLDTNSPTK